MKIYAAKKTFIAEHHYQNFMVAQGQLFIVNLPVELPLPLKMEPYESLSDYFGKTLMTKEITVGKDL